jgi:5-dehydro-2-deoxygluconokinase
MKNPKQLYFLPFDHRATFIKGLLGFEGKLSKAQKERVKNLKNLIWQGFLKVCNEIENKAPLAVLADEEFGDKILKQAKKLGIVIAVTVEKSGQDIFDFEYGKKFGQHILKYKPNYAKVLIRYNPANKEYNKVQLKRLKIINDFCKKRRIGFLLELLVPATESQIKSYKTKERYDLKLRPILTRRAVYELRKAKIEPDIWKLEAMSCRDDWQKLIVTVKTKNKKDAKIIVLGRAGSKELVSFWLKVASDFSDIIGFAVGRTIFFPPLQKYLKNKLSKKQTINLIAKNFEYFIELWEKNVKIKR